MPPAMTSRIRATEIERQARADDVSCNCQRSNTGLVSPAVKFVSSLAGCDSRCYSIDALDHYRAAVAEGVLRLRFAQTCS